MFAAYKQFCDDTTVEKQNAVQEANQMIEQLETLTKEIQQLDMDVSAWEGDKKASSEVREMENADYLKTHKDYSESVDALERAINVLKKQAYDRGQGAVALTQVSEQSLIPEHAKKVISAFLAQGDELGSQDLDVTAPEANAYEFQSQGVIDMLEKLHDKFEDERTDLEKEESNARHAYEMLV